MIKAIVKRVVGRTLWRAARAGRETLRVYPWYVLGAGWAPAPRRLDYEITFACNARCRMCPLYGEHRDAVHQDASRSRSEELDTEEARHLLEDCRQLGIKHVTFTGGEPFLRNDLPELVRTATALGLETGAISNGSVLSPERASEIVASGLHLLHISLDGPEDLHNHIRRVPGMFERIDRSIRLLRAAQEAHNRDNPRITVGCTLSALNQSRVDEIVAVAAQWRTPLSFLPIFFSTPDQDEATRRMIGAADIKPEDWQLPKHICQVDVDTLADALARARQQGRNLAVEVEFGVETRDDIRNRYYDPSFADNNKCLYPWHTTRVNPEGDVYPCSLLVPMGNVRDRPLAEIWNGEAYRAFRRHLRSVGLFPKCAKCCALSKHDLLCRWLPRPRLAF